MVVKGFCFYFVGGAMVNSSFLLSVLSSQKPFEIVK